MRRLIDHSLRRHITNEHKPFIYLSTNTILTRNIIDMIERIKRREREREKKSVHSDFITDLLLLNLSISMQNAKERSVYDINIDQLKPCVIKIMITFFNYLRQTIGALREICPHSSRQVLAHTASSGWWQVRQQHADTVKRQIPILSNASFQYVCEWIYRRSIQFCCRVDWHYSRLQTRERAHDAHTHAHATVSCCWCYCEILWNVVRLEIQKVKIEITSTEFNLFCSLVTVQFFCCCSMRCFLLSLACFWYRCTWRCTVCITQPHIFFYKSLQIHSSIILLYKSQ